MAQLIIVGVDGSETALSAAREAARLAAATDAGLHIVTAFDKHESSVVGEGSERIPFFSAEEARKVAEDAAEKVRDIVQGATSGSALGKPQQVLVDEAERRDASVIVVGNRRMQGVGRVLGSIANWVAHHAPCDVYIVKTT